MNAVATIVCVRPNRKSVISSTAPVTEIIGEVKAEGEEGAAAAEGEKKEGAAGEKKEAAAPAAEKKEKGGK